MKWCHLEICSANGGRAPSGSTCACPPPAKINTVYAGTRVRFAFLSELLRTHRPDFVVTTPGIGELNDEFRDSLRLAPTAIVSYNSNHAIHW